MGPDTSHQKVLRKLSDIIERPLSIIFQQPWQLGEVPEDWKGENVTPIFKKSKTRELQAISLTSGLGKVMEKILLKSISKHMKDKKVIGSSQHGFRKSCLTYLIVFYNGATSLVDGGRAVDVLYLDFTKNFDTVSLSSQTS